MTQGNNMYKDYNILAEAKINSKHRVSLKSHRTASPKKKTSTAKPSKRREIAIQDSNQFLILNDSNEKLQPQEDSLISNKKLSQNYV